MASILYNVRLLRLFLRGSKCTFTVCIYRNHYDFQASCYAKSKSIERHLHTLMCSVSVVTVVFIHTMEDDQRLNTLVHEGDAPRFLV